MNFLPQKNEFFDLLEQLSNYMVTIAGQLQQLPRQASDPAALMQQIRTEESAADELTLSELKNLDSAFITPLDREDIMRLMSDQYELVESMTEVAYRFEMYGFGESTTAFQTPLDAVQTLIVSTSNLIKPLRAGHKLSDLEKEFREVRRRKRETEQALREVLQKRLADTSDVLATVQTLDIDRMLRAVVDRCDTVRATVQEVVLKNS